MESSQYTKKEKKKETVLFLVFAEPLTRLFISDPEVVRWGTLCVQIAALEQPTIAVSMVLAGALRGAGDTRWPMYIANGSVWLMRVPLVYLFVNVLGYGIAVAWVITAVDFLARSIIFWLYFRSGRWQRAV